MAKELDFLTKRSTDYSKWYNELVVKADLAEQADVRGCMVIKPYGYVEGKKYPARGNFTMTKEVAGVKSQDDFTHEQNLVIKENVNI